MYTSFTQELSRDLNLPKTDNKVLLLSNIMDYIFYVILAKRKENTLESLTQALLIALTTNVDEKSLFSMNEKELQQVLYELKLYSQTKGLYNMDEKELEKVNNQSHKNGYAVTQL